MTLTQEDLGQRYLSASVALDRGQLELAKREFELLLLDCPKFAPAWDGLGRCFEAADDLERAEHCFRKSMRLDRRGWASRFHWGAALHRAGELREACKWLREAVRLAPEERRIHLRLGMCHSDLSEYDRALACFQKALEQPERDIRDAELYLHIGNAETERGDYEAAEKAYERACLLAPDDPMVYHHWAVVAARKGELADAERLAWRACALAPHSSVSRLLLVNLVLDGGDWEAAAERIREMAAIPELARLARALSAELARRTGDRSTAYALAISSLRMEGPASDQAVDSALSTLRELRGIREVCGGYRFVLEVASGQQSYFRPFVVLAESQEQGIGFAAELQAALDEAPWRIAEVETFSHGSEALAGVYGVLLAKVLFPRSEQLA